jgi:hypothetical protein
MAETEKAAVMTALNRDLEIIEYPLSAVYLTKEEADADNWIVCILPFS